MKLYLDTANEDFVLALLNDKHQAIAQKVLESYPKKVELIPQLTEEILKENNFKIQDFDTFYINIGPGFFTGVRIALVYLRTIVLITKANIKTISTMQILAKQNRRKRSFKINAQGNKYYLYETNKNSAFNYKNIKVETGTLKAYDKVNYFDFLSCFIDYLDEFKSYKDVMDIEPYYIKMPQIGAKK
ncbi:tRNA (adenosine(37)-N6)-threonylcarbamoyltransferase complex dimerization subunit type 1 TsaB [Mycoplasmopsis fermentans]|uniref:tRNA (adenosine(37)-N6)-threonylcarbamoyltransferase complex dimerization subunit type 1 TsaB n=1 Tax=Mycoplasmopsis fermentans TaxID=2115 RepID=UPI000F014432|nr:tRNA (adenosine(37)-N6)-threonylcarbamoyltransferase complex dimerization subunit type 1 TsaB [Mycoplasmopsis fermentans]RMX36060.1 tRNA threonylcarbamoyl adenosine modification protein YeaZ [Mycoplasmopsis fermentans MF-I2]RMX36130.1 tRNA threonylcarbamoyl adenosine modification protein YeaZ [Mycoplasmopsis fermentans MF-I1]